MDVSANLWVLSVLFSTHSFTSQLNRWCIAKVFLLIHSKTAPWCISTWILKSQILPAEKYSQLSNLIPGNEKIILLIRPATAVGISVAWETLQVVVITARDQLTSPLPFVNQLRNSSVMEQSQIEHLTPVYAIPLWPFHKLFVTSLHSIVCGKHSQLPWLMGTFRCDSLPRG